MISKVQLILEQTRQHVTPTREERLKITKIQHHILQKVKIKNAQTVLGGSGAKNTWLKSTKDIDVYVKFHYATYKEKSNEISDILERHLKKKFKNITRLHGSRDYFQITQGEYTVEIVPILNITKPAQARNITDFSHFHVAYVNTHTKKKKNLTSEIRLAKTFAKAQRCYGAESFIRGFSGYALELLVIHYKSFLNLLTNASKWKHTTIIGSKKVAQRLNWAKKVSPLILIDPVQPERNAAAALSREKYEAFITASKAFLKKPSLDFFSKQPINTRDLEKKGELITLAYAPLQGKHDIVGSKAKKVHEYLAKRAQEYGFTMVTSLFDHEDHKMHFVFNQTPLPREYKHYGPPSKNVQATDAFKKTHAEIRQEGERVYTLLTREHTKPKNYLTSLLKDAYVQERVKHIRLTEPS